MSRFSLLLLLPVLVLAQIVNTLIYVYSIFTNPSKASKIAVTIDRSSNVSFNGNPKETISSRAYRAYLENRTWGCVLCKFLDSISKDHCKKSDGV